MAVRRLKGTWWLPTHPHDRLSGLLTLDDDEFPGLSLVGSFHGLKGDLQAAPDAILGFAESAGHVTLLNCRQTQWTFAGLNSSAFNAGMAILGQHFRSLDDVLLDEMYVHFNGLTRWSCQTGLRVSQPERLPEGRQRTAISYDTPEAIVAPLQQVTLKISMGLSQTGGLIHDVNLSERASLTATPARPMRLAWFLDQVFHPIRNLLALAM